jgi:DNA-binding transcriptional LysR family regulator
MNGGLFLNTTQIECLLALASTLNFTKASEMVHMSQSSLSKTIATLEDELELTLFTRNKRSVKLTHCGEVFVKELTYINCLYKKAITKAHNVEAGVEGDLTLGYHGVAMFNSMPKLLEAFKTSYPHINLEIKDCSLSFRSETLFKEGVDICILPDFQSKSFNKINKKLIYTDDICVVLSKNHPLANKSEISIKELKNESFATTDKFSNIRDYNFITKICDDNGFAANITHTSLVLHHTFLTINCGLAITILAEHMKHLVDDSIIFIPLSEYRNAFKLVAIWEDDENPRIKLILEVLDKILTPF